MTIQIDRCCQRLIDALASTDLPLIYVPKFREFGIRHLDGGSSFNEIEFCPWCGSRFPGSLRDEWFDQLESMGLNIDDENLPEEMKTDLWWKKRVKGAVK